MISQINTIIENAVATIPNTSYLRATDTVANTDISEIDLAGKTFVVFNNLPKIGYETRTGLLAEVPVQIRFLELDTLFNNTSQGDDIRNRMIGSAQTVYNEVMLNVEQSRIKYSDKMSIDLADNVKLYDTILTGVILEFSIFINPTNFC